MKYLVEVLVSTAYTVEVEAINAEQAERKAEDLEYKDMKEISESVSFDACLVEDSMLNEMAQGKTEQVLKFGKESGMKVIEIKQKD